MEIAERGYSEASWGAAATEVMEERAAPNMVKASGASDEREHNMSFLKHFLRMLRGDRADNLPPNLALRELHLENSGMGDDTAQKFGAEMIRTFEPRKLPSSLVRQPSGLVRQSTVQLEQQAKENDANNDKILKSLSDF